MPVIHGSIPQFFNGVSQQAPTLRRLSQVEDQVNCVSSIAEGVLPRPPSHHLATIADEPLGNVFSHTINRSLDERFNVIIKDGEIQIYDLNGVPQTVTYPAGTSYLETANPKEDLAAYTIKDYTFILNKTVRTEKALSVAVQYPEGVDADTDYYIREVTTDTISLHTSLEDSLTNSNPVQITTQGIGNIYVVNKPDEYIATKRILAINDGRDTVTLDNTAGLESGQGYFNLSGVVVPGTNYTDSRYYVHVDGDEVSFHNTKRGAYYGINKIPINDRLGGGTWSPSGGSYLNYLGDAEDFTRLEVEDIDTDTGILTITDHELPSNAGAVRIAVYEGLLGGTVQTFSALKDVSENDGVGVKYRIEGDDSSGFSTYYVEKTVDKAGTDADTYTECASPELSHSRFNPATMPHELVRTGFDTFEFRQIVWDPRIAGDELTNPFPSFIGNTINDIFLHRNRFGFLSGDNIIHSESGAAHFFNFFRTTTTQLLDSDPIDVSANNTRVADLEYAVPLSDSLVLFSEQIQFRLGTDDLLTPSTVEVEPTTEFVASMKCRPVLAGRNVYFAMERTEFSGLREYFVGSNESGNDAADITKHVPRYIPKDVFKIVPNPNDDTLYLLTEQEPNKIYVYQWYWAQSQEGLNKAQSAWHCWDLGEGSNILNIDIIDNTLFLIIERGGKTYLESINLTTRKLEPGMSFQVRLDRRGSYTGTYDPLTDTTTWTLPFEALTDAVVVRDGGFSQNVGLQVLNTTQPTPTTVQASGDLTESEVIIGFNYTKYMELSPIYKVERTVTGGTSSRLGGSLKLRNIQFSYSDSVLFGVDVTPQARGTRSKTFTAPLGTAEARIGGVTPRDGVFSVPIISKADTTSIKITSDSYLPFAITSAEWEGFYHSKAR